MRIAFVTETYPPEVNGVALTAARFVTYLRERGHVVEVLRPRQRDDDATGPRNGAPADWLSAGLPIPMYPDLRFGLARPATLARHFKATRPQLVHVVTEGPLGWAAVQAAERLGIPATSDFRTNFHQYSHYYRLGWLAPLIGGYLRRHPSRRILALAVAANALLLVYYKYTGFLFSTLDAALELGWRVEDMILLTNTHHTLVALDGYGLSIVGERAIDPA